MRMEVVWSYNDRKREFADNAETQAFADLLYSQYCSSADRLPNGNTMITEFACGRVIEVTPEREIVWEFINPGDMVFRAHRYPYDWCPQAQRQEEIPVTPVKNNRMTLLPDGTPYWLMTIRSLPTSAFRSFPIRRNDASHGCRAYRSGIRPGRHSVPGRRILSGTRNPVISTMPEESTVKQEQMTCEEDWPVGKKGGLFHPDRDYSVGDHRFHGQTDCGLASSLYQGRIRSHGLAARSHDFHRQLFHGDIRHSFPAI